MKQAVVYQTDSNGLYLHEVLANELPLAPGTYNVPYGAKLIAPPAAPVGKVAQATGDQWVLVSDHRDTALYRVDTEEKYELGTAVDFDGSVVRYLGFGDVPAWLTPVEPLPAGESQE